MPSRRQVPSILTNIIPTDKAGGNRIFTDSPYAQTPATHSPAHSDSMSSRAGKRPLEYSSRGNSPPDKRCRPPEPPSALQDRYADPTGSRIPSPPSSKKSSLAGLSKVPTSPRVASNHPRPESTLYQRRRHVRVLSPSSIESGVSTPTHHAPPAPSMLPAGELSTLQRRHVTSTATHSTPPITMQSLQRLKERKRAIAHQMTVSHNTTVGTKLMAQGTDVAYLKKERDDLMKQLDHLKKQQDDLKKQQDDLKKQQDEERNQLMRRLEQVEAFSARFDGLMDWPETLKLVHDSAKPLTERLKVLERSVAELPDLRKGLQDLETVTNQSAAPNAVENFELKSLSDRLDRLEAANGAAEKASNLGEDVSALKTANALQMVDIDTLKRWKDALPKYFSEETIKTLITHEIQAKTTLLSKTLDKKAEDMNDRLAERITANMTSLLKTQSFKEKDEKQKLANELAALHEKVKNVERNQLKTYAKADRMQKAVEKLRDEVLPDEMNQLQDMIGKLQDKVEQYREELEDTQGNIQTLSTDMSYFQGDIKKYIGPIKDDYKKTNLPLLQRVTNLQSTVGQSDLGRLPIRLDELEKAAARHLNELSTRIDELEKGTKGPKGPSFKTVGTPVLSSSAPTTPTTSNTDEQVKMAETKVKALMSTERKAMDRSLGELETRLMEEIQELRRLIEEIQASRNRMYGSSVSSVSADATITQSTQSEVSGFYKHINDINDIKTDINSLFDSLSNQDDSITVLQDFVPTLFNQHFDPFKLKIEEQLRTTKDTLEAHGRDISHLAQQVSNPPSQENSLGRQQQAQLDAIVADAATLKTDVAALRSSLLTNTDYERISQELEGFNFALRNMENRWENISTDDLYQRMVRWFTQMYPGLPQIKDEISQLKALKVWIDHHAKALNGLSHDAGHLHGLVSIASRLQDLANVTPQVLGLANRTPQLHSLANSAPTLEQLVANASQLQSLTRSHDELPQTLAEVEQACADAKIAITKAEQASSDAITAKTKAEQATSDAQNANLKSVQTEQRLSDQVKTLENLSGSVSGLQRSLHNLNSNASPFAKADVLIALQQTIATLQTQSDQERQERFASIKQLRTTLDADRSTRADMEAKINNSINDLKQTVESGKIATLEKETREHFNKIKQIRSDYEATRSRIWERFSDVQGAAAEMRRDLDTTVSTYIEPNREFFGLMGTALVVIAQLQQIVESLNQNSSVAPLKLEWQYYLPTLGQPETNSESGNSKGKGKSKQ